MLEKNAFSWRFAIHANISPRMVGSIVVISPKVKVENFFQVSNYIVANDEHWATEFGRRINAYFERLSSGGA